MRLPSQVGITLITIGGFLGVWIIFSPFAYSQELHTEDYTITDFGLKNSSTPFLTVQGKAGGSYDYSVGDEGYWAYVFKTDKGNFLISISGTDPDPCCYYEAEHLLTDDIKLNECLHTESGRGKPSFHDHTAEYLGRHLNLTSVDHVYSILVTEDDPDDACETGEHVDKIYSQMSRQG
jgi:hypothetical protein